MKAEKQIQTEILLEFGARTDMFIWRQNSGTLQTDGRFVKLTIPGCADILGIIQPGLFIAIEVKSEKGRQSKTQKNYQKAVERVDGIYIIARSVADVYSQIGYLLKE